MNRNRTSSLLVLLILSLAGCISLPDIDPGEPEAPDVEEPLPDLSVRLRSPEAKTYTNRAVEVSVEVTNGTPEAVDVFAGDELLATLTGPYTFHWDTTAKPEGSYTLRATARRGTQTFTSETREVVVDRTPPQVVLRTPSPGAQDVSVRQAIRMTFSEPINAGSLSDTTVHLLLQSAGDPVELAKMLSLSEDGAELTVIPGSRPSAPNELSITLGALADRAGNLFSNSSAWSWDYPVWLPVGGALSALPEDGGITTTPAESPALALDGQGKPTVAWLERLPNRTDSSQASAFVQRWNGTAWESLGGAVLDSSTISFAGPPTLEVDGANRVVVGAYNIVGPYVFIAAWEGHWQELGRLTNGAGGSIKSKPSLQFDDTESPLVVWSQDDGSPYQYPPPTSNIYVDQWSGTQWNAVEQLRAYPQQGTGAVGAVLKIGSANQTVVACSEFDGTTASIYVSRRSAEGWSSVGSPLSAMAGATSAQQPSLQLDAAGNPVVAWKEFNEGANSSNLYVSRWTGVAWEAVGDRVNLDSGIAQADDPVLAVDASGNPIVAWVGNDGNTTNIYVHRWIQGHWEQQGGALSANPGKTGAAHPSLRIDPEGVPVVAWDEADGPSSSSQTRNVYVYRLNR
ncbi:MAG: Ig-like domain-containing protein [Hyalangium sp.]|uniref:Ig-like domain-containing protein n=1 Tax=Hyalangium sp. TaxID=2028555 RepID=UPI003899AC23